MKMTLQIVSKRDLHAFEVLPPPLVVARTFAWISKHRRTVRHGRVPDGDGAGEAGQALRRGGEGLTPMAYDRTRYERLSIHRSRWRGTGVP